MATDPADCVCDEELRIDQYRHCVTHSWSLAGVSTHLRSWRALQESVSEEWIPADPAQEWVLRTRSTGRRIWLRGSYRSAVAHGFGNSFADAPPQERRARYGNYSTSEEASEPKHASRRRGTWQTPTPDFFAALPRDPHELLERLRSDSPDHRIPSHERLLRYPKYTGPWVYALDALRTGIVPADLRAALYRALRMLPEVSLDSETTTLDGARATAFVLANTPIRHEMFVDPRYSDYIGERETVTTWNPVFPVRPGTIIEDRAVREDVVDKVKTPGAFA